MNEGGPRSRLAVVALTAAMLLLLGSCNTTPVIPGASPDLLAFLADGTTTREEVVLKLGQPSANFEEDRILTYRIGEHVTLGYYPIVPDQVLPWQSVRHSLVLVFDEAGILKKHNLVAVQ